MLNAPFSFCSAVIIPGFRPLGKCAILLLFLPVQIEDGGGDLPQGHLGNIAGGRSQNGKGFQGVKVINAGEIFAGEVFIGVNAAPGQQHKAHAVLQQAPKPHLYAVLVQFLQKTVLPDGEKIGAVVAKVVLHDDLRRFQQALGKVRLAGQYAVAVLQPLNDCILILRLHLPDRDGTSGSAVRVGHIKDVPQLVALAGVHQEGDPRGATVHPAAMRVPEVGLGAGGGVRLLGKNQKLVTEIVLEVMGGGVQERHIVPAVGVDLAGGLYRKPDNGFRFLCHDLSLLFIARFEKPIFCGGNFGNAPGKLGNGGPDLGLPCGVKIAGGIAANGMAVTAQAVDSPPQFCPLDMERGFQFFAGSRAFLSLVVFF
ncbi:hypothetical protein [uncultured Oscillibacter sp.]|uniref:hypothetical protein n=1 Tax=uncultured Oscillibacter sp. TaxID=876091 RepID=UPI002635FAEE|nr:hypothetical protein [uncultured Oscillibacter sp.]